MYKEIEIHNLSGYQEMGIRYVGNQPRDQNDLNQEQIRMQKVSMMKPPSIMDLLFIDSQQDLPGVVDVLKILVSQLKQKVTKFCKNKNLLIVMKLREFYHSIMMKIKELEMRTSLPLIIGIFMLQQLKKQLKTQSANPQSAYLAKGLDPSTHNYDIQNNYQIFGSGDMMHFNGGFQIESYKVDMYDDDLEDDDMDLYYKLQIPQQMLVMQIRHALQSAILNKQALTTMEFVENDLLAKIENKREIQEAKINLIKMLNECQSEEELLEVMKLKDSFMETFCASERNQEFVKKKQEAADLQMLGDSFNNDHNILG